MSTWHSRVIPAREGHKAGVCQLATHEIDRHERAAANADQMAYGAALNEGRALFNREDDKGFGGWVKENLLSQLWTVEVSRDERAAAMWAAAG